MELEINLMDTFEEVLLRRISEKKVLDIWKRNNKKASN